MDEAKAALVKSKDEMAKYYDQKRTLAPDYQPGDLDAGDVRECLVQLKESHWKT